jgi:hypothetical protein
MSKPESDTAHTPGPEQAKLLARLFDDPDRKLKAFGVVRGNLPTDPESLCREINRAMDDKEAGRLEVSETFSDSAERVEVVEVRDFVKGLGL